MEKKFINADFISREKIKEVLPARFIVPNIVTLCSLSCGVTAMKLAASNPVNWKMAGFLIFIAAIFDGLDGRIARLMSGSSKFGAELDSLSDFVSFGVAPAFVMYFYSLNTCPRFGWVLALLLAICCALRLARFNTMLEVEHKPYWDYFFTGIPAPAGAMIAIFPLVLHNYDESLPLVGGFGFSAFFVLFAAIFMASCIPTICLKKIKVKTAFIPLVLIIAAFYVGMLFVDFWLALTLATISYLIFIPFGIIIFGRMKDKYEKSHEK